jgi:hypothetical protein
MASVASVHGRHDMRYLILRSRTAAACWLIALSGLLLATCTAMVTASRQLEGTQVYTVAQVQMHLARDDQPWVGRTILVRGMVAGEPAYHPVPSLVDADAAATADPLPLAWTGPDPMRAYLRRLPVLGRLVPRVQAVHWGEVALYRVQLRAAPANSCASPPCYEALLLDAAP